MSGTLGVPGNAAAPADNPPDGGTRLVPMKVGNADVWIEAPDETITLQARPGFRAVGLDPTEAFAKASDALRECVSVVGQRLDNLADTLAPDEVGVEFTITFDVEGKANIVPVLLTGKAKTSMGVKVTALWRPGKGPPGA